MAEFSTPDLCIIGAGTGGLEAATAARRMGASVVLVEKHRTGGRGLFAGAVASKALAASARMAQSMRSSAPFGVSAEDARAHFGRIRDHIESVIGALAPAHDRERFEALGVEVVDGEGVFLDRRTIKVGDIQIRARRFVIATGSHPEIPAITGIETVPYFTTDTVFSNSRRPGHLLVLGGNPIALEIAQSYRRLGAEVTVIDKGPLLPGVDRELAEVVLGRIAEEGVVLRAETEVAELAPEGNGIIASLTSNSETPPERLAVSHLLVAGGRLPSLDGLELGAARIATDGAGRLVLDKFLRTRNRRVYAIGDATGGPAMAHLARNEAERAVANALLGARRALGGETIAHAAFTDPELAEIGLREDEARARFKTRYRVLRASFSSNHRAIAEREAFGLVKLVCDPGGRLLGAGVVGPGAAELIAVFGLAVAKGLSVPDLASFVQPYPTRGDILRELATEFESALAPPRAVGRRLALMRRLP